jgi:transposase-like protein
MSEPVTRTADKWREIISRQQVGGLSIAAFCRDNAVPASSFFAWKRRLSQGRAAQKGPTPAAARPTPVGAFIEAKLLPARPHRVDAIEVRLRGGRRVLVRPGFDRPLLAQVLTVLEGRPFNTPEGLS